MHAYAYNFGTHLTSALLMQDLCLYHFKAGIEAKNFICCCVTNILHVLLILFSSYNIYIKICLLF